MVCSLKFPLFFYEEVAEMINTMVCENCTNILSNFKKVCNRCNFARCYTDRYGNIYFIRPGNFTKKFRVFFLDSRTKKQVEYDKAMYHFSFAEAQSELNALARERKWRVYDGISPADWSVVV